MDFFRSKGISNVVYGIIIVATILVFVIGFRPNATSKTASLTESCAAHVRGRCIEPKDFYAAYRVLMPSKSQAMSRRLNLKKVALDGIIERELLDDEAKRLGIGVTDKELTDQLYDGFIRVSVPAENPSQAQQILYEMYQSYVRAGMIPQDVAQEHFNDRDTAIPVDFKDPKTKLFDMKVYERQVRNLSNRSTTEFREAQARELLAAKVRDVIRDPVRVSEDEAWDEYNRRHSTATVTYIPVKESWVARWAVAQDQAAIDAWVKDHQSDYDKELDERKKDDEPKAGHIRHILVKTPYGATDDEKAVALAKLSWAVARIRAGEPFAEVAREVSDDPGSAAKGGDVGDKTDGFVAPFKAAADALKPGEMTAGAVETQFGFHFIEKDDPGKAADVEKALGRSLARQMAGKAKATDVAQALAARIDAAIKSGTGAEDAIKQTIAPYVKAQKVDTLKVLPAPPAAAGDAGAASAADASTASTAKNDKPAALPAKSFDASSDGDRPQTQTSSAFNRGGDPFQGLSPEGTVKVVSFAFSGKEGEVLADPVRTPDGWDVVQLKQRNVATREEFEKDRPIFQDELVRAKRDEALSLYVKRLREQAKDDIKVEDAYIQEAKADGGTGGSADEDQDEY
ncbi:MAG TPA: peptidylprolyl isomerase [Polyangiaceae bacterium]|nr:peptidylprolyl isomerase [Polyangiaceae bacterium]